MAIYITRVGYRRVLFLTNISRAKKLLDSGMIYEGPRRRGDKSRRPAGVDPDRRKRRISRGAKNTRSRQERCRYPREGWRQVPRAGWWQRRWLQRRRRRIGRWKRRENPWVRKHRITDSNKSQYLLARVARGNLARFSHTREVQTERRRWRHARYSMYIPYDPLLSLFLFLSIYLLHTHTHILKHTHIHSFFLSLSSSLSPL